jgi:hypothetical protein
MGRIKDLKDKFPLISMSIVDILSMIDPTEKNKYLPMLSKVINNDLQNRTTTQDLEYFRECLKRNGIADGIINGLPDSYLRTVYLAIDNIGGDNIRTLIEFMELNERSLIDENDILKYKTFEDISNAISIAHLKTMDKDMAAQIVRVFEDDTWLILRPLTFSASCKYGAATKWCTTSTSEPQHFHRYWDRGALIYILNKKTGYKIATQKYYDNVHERSTLWNAADREVSWDEVNIDGNIFNIVKDEINKKITNKSFCNEELQIKVEVECLGKKNRRFRAELDIVGENDLVAAFRNALTDPTLRDGGEVEEEIGVMEQPLPPTLTYTNAPTAILTMRNDGSISIN